MSNGMGVEKFVMMTRLAPLENRSQLIKGVWVWINNRLLLLNLLRDC